MRLIDGDALFRSIEEAEWYNNADRDEIAEELVLNAPTIEERKTGKWARQETDLMRWYICSECGAKPLYDEYRTGRVFSAYCPNCGAKMEGEDDG